jgi:hypothetical protein
MPSAFQQAQHVHSVVHTLQSHSIRYIVRDYTNPLLERLKLVSVQILEAFDEKLVPEMWIAARVQ